jgi:hypothetical protein
MRESYVEVRTRITYAEVEVCVAKQQPRRTVDRRTRGAMLVRDETTRIAYDISYFIDLLLPANGSP